MRLRRIRPAPTTRRMVLKHSLATPPAIAIQPTALTRSETTPPVRPTLHWGITLVPVSPQGVTTSISATAVLRPSLAPSALAPEELRPRRLSPALLGHQLAARRLR